MTHTEYSAKRRMMLVRFGQLGITGVSKAFPLLKETADSAADTVRYTNQLADMTDNLHNYRAARRGR